MIVTAVSRLKAKVCLDVKIEAPTQVRIPRSWVGAITAVLMVAVLYVFQAAMPANVLRLPSQLPLRQLTQDFFPQGWAFFTKPVSSEILYPFQVTDGSFEPRIVNPNGSPQYLFGWNRLPRNQGVEMASLLTGISQSAWTQCREHSLDQCMQTSLTHVHKVTNRMPVRSLCGSIVISAEQTTAWAYRNLSLSPTVPKETLALDVVCR